MIRWAEVTLIGDDEGQFPIQQVNYSGKPSDAFVHLPYGMHANIPLNGLGVMLIIQGDSEHRIFLPTSFKDRPKPIDGGEVVWFHPPTGTKIHFRTDGSIDLETVGGNFSIDVDGAITVVASDDVSVSTTGNSSIESTQHTIDADLEHIGTNVGFHGATPVPQASPYTVTNPVDNRAFDTTTATLGQIRQVVGTIIGDLQAKGFFG